MRKKNFTLEESQEIVAKARATLAEWDEFDEWAAENLDLRPAWRVLLERVQSIEWGPLLGGALLFVIAACVFALLDLFDWFLATVLVLGFLAGAVSGAWQLGIQEGQRNPYGPTWVPLRRNIGEIFFSGLGGLVVAGAVDWGIGLIYFLT
jgi:hypothetical protein